MRNTFFSMNISIDGCCEHTNLTGPTDELYEYYTALLQGADLVVYGRKTYELMIPYWPDVAAAPAESEAEHKFAKTLTPMDKIVFSHTLKSAEANTRVINTDLKSEILKLKQQPGKNISIGSISLFSQLLELGLIDEMYLVVHPIIVGKGRRLFDDMNFHDKLNMKLAEAKTFETGAIGLHYMK